MPDHDRGKIHPDNVERRRARSLNRENTAVNWNHLPLVSTRPKRVKEAMQLDCG